MNFKTLTLNFRAYGWRCDKNESRLTIESAKAASAAPPNGSLARSQPQSWSLLLLLLQRRLKRSVSSVFFGAAKAFVVVVVAVFVAVAVVVVVASAGYSSTSRSSSESSGWEVFAMPSCFNSA